MYWCGVTVSCRDTTWASFEIWGIQNIWQRTKHGAPRNADTATLTAGRCVIMKFAECDRTEMTVSSQRQSQKLRWDSYAGSSGRRSIHGRRRTWLTSLAVLPVSCLLPSAPCPTIREAWPSRRNGSSWMRTASGTVSCLRQLAHSTTFATNDRCQCCSHQSIH